MTSLPRVDILYGQQEFDARLLESALSYGDVKGIIVPGPDGAGLNDEVIDRVAGQIPVVLAWRVNNGLVGPDAVAPEGNSTISAGLVNSHKSRILLQLALATGKDPRDVFEAQLRQTLYGN
jgi:L-asparaginase